MSPLLMQACMQPYPNLGSTKGVLLMLEMSQLVIKEMACPDFFTDIGLLLSSEQPLLCVEGVQHIVLFVPGIILPKHFEDLAVTHQSV